VETRPVDTLYGQRVYSWVLVRAGKRDVNCSFFIDPPTGRHQQTDAPGTADYLGVESVWNHRNYHVNMQHCSTAVQVHAPVTGLPSGYQGICTPKIAKIVLAADTYYVANLVNVTITTFLRFA